MPRKTLNSLLLLLLALWIKTPPIAASEFALPSPPSDERTLTAPLSLDLKSNPDERTVAESETSSAAAVELARRVLALREAGDNEAAAELRAPWTRPNFVVHLGSELIAPRQLAEPILNTQAVRENILGTSISGKSQTEGRISTQLVPRDDAASIDVVLRGKTVTQSRGVNGPATVFTTSNGQFAAISRLKISEEGIRYTRPRAAATNRSTLHDVQVSARLFPGLVRSIAQQRAAGLQPQADEIAARRAEARYEEAMDAQLKEGIERANKAYRTKVLEPLTARGALWESIRFGSTAESLSVRVVYANQVDPAAASDPPRLSDDHVLSFQAHESLLRNAAQMLLRGQTLSDHQLAGAMKILLGEIPRDAREFRLGEHLEPWSITLADDHPVAVELADGQLELGVRTARVTIGERNVPAQFLIEATYEVNFTPSGPQLLRVGEVRILPDEHEPIRPSSEVQDFVERKARSFFLSEIWFDGLVPPTGGAFDKVAELSLKELKVDQGWISLGYGNDPEPIQTALKP